jgi:hypothetical protein
MIRRSSRCSILLRVVYFEFCEWPISASTGGRRNISTRDIRRYSPACALDERRGGENRNEDFCGGIVVGIFEFCSSDDHSFGESPEWQRKLFRRRMLPIWIGMSGWDLLQGWDAIRQRRQILFRSQLPEVNETQRGRLSWHRGPVPAAGYWPASHRSGLV